MDRPRRKRKRDVSDFDMFRMGMADTEAISAIDNDTLAYKTNEASRKSKAPKISDDNVISWTYASVNEVRGIPEYDYISSCDEIDDDFGGKTTEKSLPTKKSFFFGNSSESEGSGITIGSEDSPNDSMKENHSFSSDRESLKLSMAREENTMSDFGNDIEETLLLPQQEEEEKDVPPSSPSLPSVSKRKRNDDFCVGCYFGSIVKEPAIGEVMNHLLSLLHENYAQVDDKVLAKNIHKMYKILIWKKCQRLGIPCKLWRSRSILEHIRKHWRDPRVFISSTDMRLQNEIDAIETMIFRKENYLDGGSQYVCDINLSKHRNELIKLRAALLKLDPKKLAFFNDKRNIDMEKIGGFINSQTFIRISPNSL